MVYENSADIAESAAGKAAELYLRYKRLMVHYAKRVLHNPDWVDDAVQDAVYRMLRDIDKFDGVENPASVNLLITMVKYSAAKINYANSRHGFLLQSEEVLDDLADDLSNTQIEVERSEFRGILREEIERLPETYRDPMLLRYAQDIDDNHAIADILGITANNVAVRLVRGRSKLIVQLRRRGDLP